MIIACLYFGIFVVSAFSFECPDKNCMNGGIFLNCNCECKSFEKKFFIRKNLIICFKVFQDIMVILFIYLGLKNKRF